MKSAASATEPAIVADNAAKLFLDGAVVAFHQLSLQVRRDEIMCVVGPSGLRQDHACCAASPASPI